MTASFAVAQAQAALADAEKAEAQERRTTLVAQLQQIRSELPVERQKFEALSKTIRETQTQLDNLRRNLIDISDALGASLSSRPEIFSFLPDDPICTAWAKRHSELEAKQQELLQQRANLKNVESLRLDAVNIGERVKALTGSEANIIRRLRGESFDTLPKSELSGVL